MPLDLNRIRAHIQIVETHLRELLRVILDEQAKPTTIDDTYEIDTDIPAVGDAVDLLVAAGMLANSPYGLD